MLFRIIIILFISLISVSSYAQTEVGDRYQRQNATETERRILRLERGTVDFTKTITGTLPLENGGTGTDLSNAPHGSIVFIDSDGDMDYLTPSTTRKVLSTNGSDADPTWVEVLPDYEDGTNIETVIPEVFGPRTSSYYGKAFEFAPLLRGGEVTVKWGHTCRADNNPAKTVTSRVYVNDIAVGTEYTNASDEGFTFNTETGLTVTSGDEVSVYYKTTTGGSACSGYAGVGQILVSNPTYPYGYDSTTAFPTISIPTPPNGCASCLNWDASTNQMTIDATGVAIKTTAGTTGWQRLSL